MFTLNSGTKVSIFGVGYELFDLVGVGVCLLQVGQQYPPCLLLNLLRMGGVCQKGWPLLPCRFFLISQILLKVGGFAGMYDR